MDEEFHFWAGAQRWTSPKRHLTGAEIKKIANISPLDPLYLDTGSHASTHIAIGDGEATDVAGNHFYGLIPATHRGY